MKAVNLIPAEHHGASVPVGRSGGAAYAVVALLAGLAILALMYGLASHKISDGNAKLASLKSRTAQAQQRASALSPYTSFLSLREQRVQAVNELVGSRFDWASAFYEFGRVLPHNAAITSLNGTVGSGASSAASASSSTASSGGAVKSATPPGSIPSFSLTGCAASQSQVAFVLQRLRLINGVHEVQLQSSTKSANGGSSGSAPSGSGAQGCGGGEASWSAQVVFEPMPSVSANGSSGTTTTVATPTTGAATPATPSGPSASGSASSTSSSTSTTSSTPSPSAGAAASGSSAPSSGAAQ